MDEGSIVMHSANEVQNMCLPNHMLLMTVPYSFAGKILLDNLGISWNDNSDKKKASIAGLVRLFMKAASCRQHQWSYLTCSVLTFALEDVFVFCFSLNFR